MTDKHIGANRSIAAIFDYERNKKLCLYEISCMSRVMKSFGGDEVALFFFSSNSALDGGDLSESYPLRFVSGDNASRT
jgi:hypothetical protein